MLNCGNETVQRITEMYYELWSQSGISENHNDKTWKIDEEIMHDEYYR